MDVLLVLNALVSASTVVAAAIALVRPRALSGSVNPDKGEHYFSRMYASRAIPLGIVAGVLPFLSRDDAVVWVLVAAAAAQVADVAIGVRTRVWGMVGGGSFAMLVYGITAVAIAR